MHGELAPTEPLVPYLTDYEETDAAEDNEPAGHQIEHHVVPIGNQVLKIAQNIKAGIIKRRHRVEKTDSDGIDHRIILHKDSKAQNGAGELKNQSSEKHALYKADNAFSGIQIHSLSDQSAPLEIDPPAHGENHACPHGCNAQSADLNEHGEKKLAYRGKCVSCIHGDQAGHADRAGGSIEGVDIAEGDAVPDAYGKHYHSITSCILREKGGESRLCFPERLSAYYNIYVIKIGLRL